MEVYVARQPIFDRNLKLVGYELLHRSSNHNSCEEYDGDKATDSLLYNILNFGFEDIMNSKVAFINFTEGGLIKKLPTLLPKEMVIVEILENVTFTDEVVVACKQMADKGYKLALDDYEYKKQIDRISDFITIIKVDFKLNDRQAIINICRQFKKTKIKLLAEKIETEQEYEFARNLGFSYFQGYYFSKPQMLKGKDVLISRPHAIDLFIELNHETWDIDKIEKIIKSDTIITFKLLKYVNSSLFSLREEVKSIRQALALLGRERIKKWFILIMLGGSSVSSIQDEYIKNSMLIGRMCEELCAETMVEKKDDAFFVGTFSSIDKIIDSSMEGIVDTLPLDSDVKEALLGVDNELRDILNIVLAYINLDDYKEKYDDFIKANNVNKKSRVSDLSDIYLQSITWLEKV